MRLAMVMEGAPSTASAGSAMANWTIIDEARQRDHNVLALVVEPPGEDDGPLETVKELGVDVEQLAPPAEPDADRRLSTRLGRLLAPEPTRYYPTAALAPELAKRLQRWRPDAIYACNYGPAATLTDVRPAPTLAILGDPLHLVLAHRLQTEEWPSTRASARARLEAFGLRRVLPRWIVSLMRPFEARGWFGAQHAAWLSARGVPCDYIRVPVTDLAGPSWQERRRGAGGGVPRIVLMGGVAGTASRAGHEALEEVVVPRLDAALGRDGYRLDLIGSTRHGVPQQLARLNERPGITLRGYVEDVASELLAADVFLFPAHYPVGIRTRIITAMSFGCAIVTDSTALLGAPELHDGKNVLVADTPQLLADRVLEALGSPQLRERLGAGARTTYEQSFSRQAAGGHVVDTLERIGSTTSR